MKQQTSKTNAKTETINPFTFDFELGQKVFNPNFDNYERQGEIVKNDKGYGVSFLMGDIIKLAQTKLEIWQPLPTIEDIAKDAENASKQSANGDSTLLSDILKSEETKDKTPKPVKDAIQPLTKEEVKELNGLKRQYLDLDKKEQYALNQIPFEKGKILNQLRKFKTFGQYKTFAEYVVKELGITREYAQNLAQIGAFIGITSDFLEIEKVSYSVNAVNRLVRNQKTIAETILQKDTELADFKDLLGAVIDTTIETVKDTNGDAVITPNAVDVVNKNVVQLLKANNLDQTIDNVLSLASNLVKKHQAKIALDSQKELAQPKEKKVNKCEGHTQIIVEIVNNILTTSCGCKWRLIAD